LTEAAAELSLVVEAVTGLLEFARMTKQPGGWANKTSTKPAPGVPGVPTSLLSDPASHRLFHRRRRWLWSVELSETVL